MSTNYDANNITLNGVLTPDSGWLSLNTTTQLTNITTACTSNSIAGIITTVSSTLATGGAMASFAVNNSFVTANSSVLSAVVGYSGTSGSPACSVSGISAGSFDVNLVNVSSQASSPLNGTVSVGYLVL